MKIIWHFNDDEHKKEFEETLINFLAESAMAKYPNEMKAAIEYADKGLLNLD